MFRYKYEKLKWKKQQNAHTHTRTHTAAHKQTNRNWKFKNNRLECEWWWLRTQKKVKLINKYHFISFRHVCIWIRFFFSLVVSLFVLFRGATIEHVISRNIHSLLVTTIRTDAIWVLRRSGSKKSPITIETNKNCQFPSNCKYSRNFEASPKCFWFILYSQEMNAHFECSKSSRIRVFNTGRAYVYQQRVDIPAFNSLKIECVISFIALCAHAWIW